MSPKHVAGTSCSPWRDMDRHDFSVTPVTSVWTPFHLSSLGSCGLTLLTWHPPQSPHGPAASSLWYLVTNGTGTAIWGCILWFHTTAKLFHSLQWDHKTFETGAYSSSSFVSATGRYSPFCVFSPSLPHSLFPLCLHPCHSYLRMLRCIDVNIC